MKIERWKLDRVKPYEKNPRINDAAVNESLFENEVWRPIPDYEKLYEVSSYGRVRRSCKSRIAPEGYVLKPRLTRDGYVRYSLSKRQRYWHIKAHRLVALAFLGSPPFPGAHVAHYDGNRLNNHVSNLRWATSKENEADKKRHGTAYGAPPGDKHPHAKLTSELVQEMRRLAASGIGMKAGATRFGIAYLTAYDAIVGNTWKTVKIPPPLPRPRSKVS